MIAVPDFFHSWAQECAVEDSQTLAQQLGVIYELLLRANAEVNLTRIVDERGFWLKHVADSLAIGRAFPELVKKPLQVADIGCGAGFPSLVLALAYPQWRITAIDSVGKKTAFVESVGAGLELDNLRVIHGRTKEMNCQRQYMRKFDLLTARAVGPAVKLYTEAYAMLKSDGECIFYKTPEQLETELPELKQLPERYNKLHWRGTGIFELPEAAGHRGFIHGTAPRTKH